jgi:RNA polymerase sigma factor (sigma-70 family)
VETITDVELVEKVQEESCNNSLKELINRHSALCVDICKKYTPALYASGVPCTDVYEDKDYIVYKSALSFKPEKKVKFSTWLGNQVRYHCLNAINGKGYLLNVENDDDLDFFIDQTQDRKDEENKLEVQYIFSILAQLRDPRIKEVFNLRYFKTDKKKMPWSEIGRKMSVSTQTAINLHQRGLEILNKKMNSKDPDRI